MYAVKQYRNVAGQMYRQAKSKTGQKFGLKDNRGCAAVQGKLLQTIRASDCIKETNGKPTLQLMAWVISRDLNLGMSTSSNSKSSSSRAPREQALAGSSHGSSDSSGGAVSSGIILSPTILPIVGSDSSTISSSGSSKSSEGGSKQSTSDQALTVRPQRVHGEQSSEEQEDTGDQSVETQQVADAKNIIDQPNSTPLDLENRASVLGKIFHLKFHHRHILFDKTYNLPKVDESNNVGYGGVLYKESSLNGYAKNNQISNNDTEDELLISAIRQYQNYGPYRLLTHNCQHWVNDVNASFEQRKG